MCSLDFLMPKFLQPLSDFSLDKKRILIAKTTHVGDVVITLPIAGILKYYYPNAKILFLAKGAGCDIARRYHFIDEVYSDELIDSEEGLKACKADVFIQVNNSKRLANAAQKAEIPVRIGSVHRIHNWSSCTHLAMISPEHKQLNKRQLDFEYLKLLNIEHQLSYADFSFLYQFKAGKKSINLSQSLNPNKFKLILHPSLITAKKYQWPLGYFKQLIQLLDPEKFQIFITGIESDKEYLHLFLDECKTLEIEVVDMVGKLNMDEFITFISHCDGLVAGSTGPLHLAAALGIHALGVYRAEKTYIKRWEAVGYKAEVLSQPSACSKCPTGNPCRCILSILPEIVKSRILSW
jgi:heptosyltransferase III